MIATSKKLKYFSLPRLTTLVLLASALLLSIQNLSAQSTTKKIKTEEQTVSSDTSNKTHQKVVIHLKDATNLNAQKTPVYIVDGKELNQDQIKDLNPREIKSINVVKGDEATREYGNKGKNGVIIITMKTAAEKMAPEEKTTTKSSVSAPHLTYLDGKLITAEEEQKISADDIQSINILKGDNAIKKYGVKAKDGVIEITLKKPV